jgi:hypothetical protein
LGGRNALALEKSLDQNCFAAEMALFVSIILAGSRLFDGQAESNHTVENDYTTAIKPLRTFLDDGEPLQLFF